MLLHTPLPQKSNDRETRFVRAAGVVLQQQSSLDSRRADRKVCNDPAEVRRLPLDGSSWPARVVDASEYGLGVTLNTQLSRGSRIEVILAKQVMFGEVRYCIPMGKMFRVGLVLEAVFQTKLPRRASKR